MNKRFKIPKFIRVTLYFIVVVFIIFALLPDLYNVLFSNDFHGHVDVLSIVIGLIIISLSISFSRTEYFLSNETIGMKSPFEKDKIYSLDEIQKIEEVKSVIPYLKIYVTSKKRPLILLIDNIEEFVGIILMAQKNKREIEFSKNNRVVTFSKHDGFAQQPGEH